MENTKTAAITAEGYSFRCADKEHFEFVENAIEKQTPKKPYYWGDGYDKNGNLIYDQAKCPACGNDDYEEGINNWGRKFCPDCGQALDWSETE